MRGPCVVVPYITENGRSPVLEFLRELEQFDETAYANYLYAKDLLIEGGTDVGAPHWKWIGDGLGEVRWRSGKVRFRIYGSEETNRQIFLAHPTTKDYRTVDPGDKAIALKRQAEFRSSGYNQAQRQKLYDEKQNARNQQTTDARSSKRN
jgi:phage-related protein